MSKRKKKFTVLFHVYLVSPQWSFYSFCFLLFFPLTGNVSLLFCCSFFFCCPFPILFLMFQSLSVVSLTLCHTSLLLFVHQSSVTYHCFGLPVSSILSMDIIFLPFALPLPHVPMVFLFSVVCLSSMINSSAYRKFLTHLKMSENYTIAKIKGIRVTMNSITSIANDLVSL